jgi:16S rRNA G1207 methylase RsmC
VEGLNPADSAISALGRRALISQSERVLLVHCGDVPSIPDGATRLILDLREREQTRHRCIEALRPSDQGSYDLALCWHRPHLGMDFALEALADATWALAVGGRLLLACRPARGGKRLRDALARMVGSVETLERRKGVHVIEAVKQSGGDGEGGTPYRGVRYPIVDPRTGPQGFETVPGIFSRRELDRGTGALLDALSGPLSPTEVPTRVVDLGTGAGPIALWAAKEWGACQLLAVDTNLRAVACARANLDRAGVGTRARVEASDGFPSADSAVDFMGATDLVLSNPPTHAPTEDLEALMRPLPRWLSPTGRALFVINRPGRLDKVLRRLGAQLSEFPAGDGFRILEARFARGPGR